MGDIVENALPSAKQQENPASAVKKDLTTTLVSVGASALVLFVTVWVVGKAWKKSQNS